MKKSTRILSLIMAMMMLLGTFSVFGSAYRGYKGNDVNYDDIDAATFTTEQYASMGLDEVDRMLAEEQLSVYIYIGTLDVTSIDNAVASVESLLESVSTLLALLGDAQNLNIASLAGKRRSAAAGTYATDADLEIVYSVFDFLYDNAGILQKYVQGNFSLGILNSFVADYVFDVRELLIGLIFGATEAGKAIDYDYFDDGAGPIPTEYTDANNGILNILQGLLNDLVLGTWQQLDDYFNNPYDDHDEVRPGFYAFEDAAGNDVSNQAINTDDYDYYGWVHPKQWVTVGLGGAVRVAKNSAAPAPDYELVDITGNLKAYDFIEALLQRAFNYVLVPVLNRDTAPWLKEQCGYEFPDQFTKKQIFDEATGEWVNNPTYNENFAGIAPEGVSDNALWQLFETENLVIEKATIPSGTTLVENLNDILGDFVDAICKYDKNTPVSINGGTYSWNWVDGGNHLLFTNICNVARFVLEVTGDEFFGSTVKTKTAEEISQMNDQQVVAYVIRAILNSSVDWMYISDEYQTVAEVGYRAVEQLAWQDIPQITYTKPSSTGLTNAQYYDALVNKALTILLDVAAYRLNQEMDMNAAEGSSPRTGAGLIPYQGDNGSYENSLVMIAEWAIKTYGRALALNLNLASNGTHTADQFWSDIDTILNGIIPFKGNDSILALSIAGQDRVFKSLVFENILKPIYNLDATNLVKIFDKNNGGVFATKNGVETIMMILNKVFDLLFPNVFKTGLQKIDHLVVNDTLAAMVYDLVSELGRNAASRAGETNGLGLVSRTTDLVFVALPIVCQVLGLSDDQEFGELECFMPGTISSSTTSTDFFIYNSSSGINTGYTSVNGTVTKDKSYTYQIIQVFAKATRNGAETNLGYQIAEAAKTIPGGGKSSMTVSGYQNGDVIALSIVYNVKDESGANMTEDPLTNTFYAYVGTASKDDDAIEQEITVGNRKIKYEKEIYIPTGASFSKVANYGLRIEDNKDNQGNNNPPSVPVTITSVSVNNATYPFVTKNTDTGSNSASLNGQGGTYFINPFEIAKKANGEEYERFAVTYQMDEDGKYILDENDEKIAVEGGNGGVPVGVYTVTTTLNIGGTSQNVTTRVHIYDDFGLEGAFNKAAATNRQSTNYDVSGQGYFNAYIVALQNAATLALKPKNGNTFEADYAYTGSGNYENRYEQYSVELQNAIDALKPYELSEGTTAIENALAAYSGFNYDVVTVEGYDFRLNRDWDDNNCIYFGYEDFVPHTYNRYKAARNSALNLVDSQKFYFSPDILVYDEEQKEYVIDDNASDEAKARFAKEKEDYENFQAPAINAVTSEYAVHMVNLMGGRLIALNADKSKLNIVRGFAVKEANVDYTSESLANYNKALAFANAVAADNSTTLRPSKVKKATSELVAAWKELAIGADYTSINNALADARVLEGIAAGTPDMQGLYTQASFNPFYEAYETVLDLQARGLSATTENQAMIDAAALNLINMAKNLVEEGSAPSDDVVCVIDENVEFESDFGTCYTPMVYDEMFDSAWEKPTINGQEINHLLYGIGEGYWPEDFEDIFVVQNGSVEVLGEDCGSGTVINIKNNSGEIVDSYLVIIRGDVDGDSSIGLSDRGYVFYYIFAFDYSVIDDSDPELVYSYFAADANGDGNVDNIDYMLIFNYFYGIIDIDQTSFEF